MGAIDYRAEVDKAWRWLQIRLAEPYEGARQGQWVVRLPLLPAPFAGFDTEEEALESAYLYTESVREECRQLDREIEQQHHFESELHRGTFPGNMDALQSTIKRLRTLREAAGRWLREEK